MKTKATLLLVLIFGLNFSFAQTDCATKLSLMVEAAKAKSYDTAYPYLMELRKDCPTFNRATYVYGERILNSKIDASEGEEKKAFINDLVKLYDESMMHFASKSPKGEFMGKACQLKYDNRELLGLTGAELYPCFDSAYTADSNSFDNPQSLYVYFKLMVDLYDEGKKPAADLFNKYDDVVEKIDVELEKASEKLNGYVSKEEAGQTLSSKDASYKRFYEQTIAAFEKISASVDSELGGRANCENLIPLYAKDFEANKENAVWLKRAVSRMYNKECTEDALYEKLLKAYDAAESSADTKYFLASFLFNSGKVSEAMTYYKQSYDLQDDKVKKAKLAYKIGANLKKKGRFGEARQYFENALALNPSDKNPHLLIASMYASSANDCGDSRFNKLAVFWLASKEAAKAGSRGSSYVESYNAKAPTKSMIFSEGNSGETIRIGCWIGRSVTVPKL